MANPFDKLIDMINKIVKDATKFNVPRMGIISQTTDSLGKGRILVLIPSLGWDTDEKGAWCYAKDKKAIITPQIGDYVIVEFIDGDRDLPVYSGIATQMKDMLPINYDGSEKTQILFESDDSEVLIKVDETTKELYQKASEILLEAASSLSAKGGGLEISISATGISLITGDAATWKPNVLAVDPFTGLPHGGVVAGIIKLTGA